METDITTAKKKYRLPVIIPDPSKWYTVDELATLPTKETLSLEAKRKNCLTCDLTWKDVMNCRAELEFAERCEIASILGYPYLVDIFGNVWEMKHLADNTADWEQTNLTEDDINEIL